MMKSITIRLEEDVHRKLKMKTVAEGTSIQDEMALIVENYIKTTKDEK